MCGVAGILNLDGASASPVALRRMTDAIAHRGPDGEGHYTDGALGLGHRRLAIIDLSPGGRQPMATPGGRYVISYNGEIYNFQELRTELQDCPLRTQVVGVGSELHPNRSPVLEGVPEQKVLALRVDESPLHVRRVPSGTYLRSLVL